MSENGQAEERAEGQAREGGEQGEGDGEDNEKRVENTEQRERPAQGNENPEDGEPPPRSWTEGEARVLTDALIGVWSGIIAPPPDPVLASMMSDEERERLQGVGEDLFPTWFDAEQRLKDAQAVLNRMDRCLEPNALDDDVHGCPTIRLNWKLREQLRAARAALLVENLKKLAKRGFEEGVVYKGEAKGRLQTVVRDGTGFAIDALDTKDIAVALLDGVCWVGKKGGHEQDLPGNVKSQLSTMFEAYPPLAGVVQTPRWSTDGEEFHVASTVGYDRRTATFVGRDFGIVRNPAPTKAQVAAAVDVIMDLIGEFPYDDDFSETNTFGFALTVPLRRTTTTAPLFPITAHAPHSGKSLLVETIGCVALNSIPMPQTLAYQETGQERRNISAMLAKAQRVGQSELIWFDEPKSSHDHSEFRVPMLNAIATSASGKIGDRPVFEREYLDLGVQYTWPLTANNLHPNAELDRRSVLIRMRKQKHYRRTEDELRDHALKQHVAFHQAVVTLLDHWSAEGRPRPEQRFGSFNAWNDLVGGILEAIGRKGLRGNAGASSPYQHAKAAWLQFLMDRLQPKRGRPAATAGRWTDRSRDILEVEASKLETMLRAEKTKPIAQALLDRLLTYAPRGEGAPFELLVRNLDSEKKVRLAPSLSKVMRQVLDFDGVEGEDGVTYRGTRVESNGDHPLCYRFTTTAKRLDFRGGQR